MAVRGHVNGMAGGYVIGWALGAGAACSVAVTDDAGVVLASGLAALEREDLVSLGVGRTDLAFRIPVTNGPARRMLHVLADGEELAGSPIVTGAGTYDTGCEIVRGAVVGWVTERVATFEAPLIRVINQHGVVVGEARAVQDPAEPDPLYVPARFEIELDDSCFGCGALRLRLFANGVRFAERAAAFPLEGNLDLITDESYAGWLVCPDVPARAFCFDVFQNGVLAGTGRCNLARDDVRALYPDCVTPGFSLTLPKPGHSALDTTAVSFRFRGSELDLFEGPYVVGSRPAAVLAAQRAAQATYRGIEGLGVAERAVVQVALHDFMDGVRRGEGFSATRQQPWPVPVRPGQARPGPRLTIVVPIYRDVAVTRACIQSILAHRNAATDHVVLVNDASPEPEMAALLGGCVGAANLFLLSNKDNLGFVKTANRGIVFALGGDVLLLNSDTLLFAGGLDEMCRVAAVAGVGTVTAMSNNATIFSYPHPALLDEVRDEPAVAEAEWPELARVALAENAGLAIDVPTGHGFCMLIKGEVLRRIGALDEAFGRGYGEENDFCARAAGWGYRNVAAAGVVVLHRERVSFGPERERLMALNEPRLTASYPEFLPAVHTFIDRDGLRRARWALDRARLRKAAAAGARFVLLVSNALEGGTVKAIGEIEAALGEPGAVRLNLRVREDGLIELSCAAPWLRAAFSPHEIDALFEMLAAAKPARAMVHQLLGFPAAFVARIGEWARGVNSVYVAHDFYPLCPRVTLVDAIGEFCDVAAPEVCARCVKVGGAHPTSRLTELTPAAHRALFAGALAGFGRVLAPSENTVGYLRRVFPDLAVEAAPHPEPGGAAAVRTGGDDEVVLLGAIGAAKGSGKLLEIAGRARLSHPKLRFRVIGHTDIDAALLALGNVVITGKYKAAALPGLVGQAKGRLALFLHGWPETYSYTLSEAARFGFVPLVPDIGAPADRVRAAGFGVVYPFPVVAARVLELIEQVAAGLVPLGAEGTGPADLFSGRNSEKETAYAMPDGGNALDSYVATAK